MITSGMAASAMAQRGCNQRNDGAEQLVLRGGGVYRRLVVRDNRLVGAVLVGDKRNNFV